MRISISTVIGACALGCSSIPCSAAAAGPTDADSSGQLEVIIVTAQKRSEDVQSVPMSISRLGADDLEQTHATELTDYAGYIPGLQFQNTGSAAQGALSLRGIPPLGAGSTVATYLDETPLGSSSNYGNGAAAVLDLLPYDVQSFEVLRGPQGTLYGASSLGGLVKYVTKAPDLEQFSGRVGGDVFGVDGADKAGFGGRASVNVPLIPGKLGLRASFAREN